MTIKAISLATTVCAAVLCVFSILRPGDPYFFFISSNTVVDILRLVIAAVMVKLAIEGRFRYAGSHKLAAAASASLGLLALAGLFWPTLDYALFNIFKPLDYILFLEFSIFFGLTYLTFKRGTYHLPRPIRPRLVIRSLNLRRA